MSLSKLLSTLDAPKAMAQIYEADETTLVSEIRASTYQSLDDALEARTVKKWSLLSNGNIKIILEEVESNGAG